MWNVCTHFLKSTEPGELSADDFPPCRWCRYGKSVPSHFLLLTNLSINMAWDSRSMKTFAFNDLDFWTSMSHTVSHMAHTVFGFFPVFWILNPMLMHLFLSGVLYRPLSPMTPSNGLELPKAWPFCDLSPRWLLCLEGRLNQQLNWVREIILVDLSVVWMVSCLGYASNSMSGN